MVKTNEGAVVLFPLNLKKKGYMVSVAKQYRYSGVTCHNGVIERTFYNCVSIKAPLTWLAGLL